LGGGGGSAGRKREHREREGVSVVGKREKRGKNGRIQSGGEKEGRKEGWMDGWMGWMDPEKGRGQGLITGGVRNPHRTS
jgi:hypothetical protein